MKHVFSFLLLMAVTGNVLFAQFPMPNTQSESLFNYPKPGSTKATFYFWYQKNNRVTMEMMDIRQLNYIPNLDSVVQEAFHSIKNIKDSFKNDGLVRRVDYVSGGTIPPQIRIVTHQKSEESFSYLKGELVQTKIDKDTLRIRINTPYNPNTQYREGGVLFKGVNARPFVIMILVDNFDDLTTFPTNAMEQCVNKVKVDLSNELAKNGKLNSNYRAYYNMQTDKRFSPNKPKYIGYGSYTRFIPTIHFGIQYARGSFVPSAAAGLQYYIKDGSFSEKFIRAYWEPYFFFSREANNKLVTQRNDFITLRFTELYTRRELNKINTTTNFSLGYLAGRRGNWFEPNTFKIGTPGFMAGSLMFEPEFFFNDAFRNFSPSLKMTLLFE